MSNKDFITFSEEESECILAGLSVSRPIQKEFLRTINEIKLKILQKMLNHDTKWHVQNVPPRGIPFLGVCK